MRNSLALALCVLSFAGAAWGKTTVARRAPSDFHRLAEVDAPALTPGEAYAVSLSYDAIAMLRFKGELRLFDSRGVEIPSVIHTRKERRTVSRSLTIYDSAWEPGLIQTLAVDRGAAAREAINEFTLTITDRQYNARVQVHGRDGDEEWRIVRDNLHLIRHAIPAENIRYTHNTLRVPLSRFRYFRFLIAASGRTGPLTVTGVAVQQIMPDPDAFLRREVFPVRWTNPKDPDERREYWLFDLGATYLGMTELHLQFGDGDFARPARLQAWDPKRKRPGRHLARAMLYRYGDDSQTALKGFAADAQRLVLVIDHGDNAPLPLTGATAARPKLEVRFLAEGGITPPLRLYVKPDEARTPNYDLAKRLAKRKDVQYTALAHGIVIENAGYAEPIPPLSERVPYLLYAFVVPVVLLMGWYIARVVKAGVPADPPPAG